MGRRRRRRGFSRFSLSAPSLDISDETKQSIAAVVLILLSILTFLSLIDLAGTVGVYVSQMLRWIAGGFFAWIMPFIFFIWGYFLLRPAKYELTFGSYIGLGLFVLSSSGLIHLIGYSEDLSAAASAGQGGGYIGLILSQLFLSMLGFPAALTFLIAFVLIGMFLFFNTSFHELSEKTSFFSDWKERRKDAKMDKRVAKAKAAKEEMYDDDEEEEDSEFESKEIEEEDDDEEEEDEDEETIEEEEDDDEDAEEDDGDEAEDMKQHTGVARFKVTEVDMPISLLSGKTGKPKGGDLEANMHIIKKTLEDFGVKVEMGEAQVGPTVTQYTLKPAAGVKLSRINGLSDNLALALAAHPIRIEAPIPGRSLVGIEVPNTAKASVSLRDVIDSKPFKNRESNLMISLGKDVMGKPWLADLAKMPHLLIAGSTGSGKSVCVNSLVLSLLFQNSPGDLKFIMVDPKRVELTPYNGIPHLLTPVITDVKKTINALRWAVAEMEKRFEVLSQAGARDLASYNKKNPEHIPYIVLIIDELADIMAASAAEVEQSIVRLSQMARAVGIHLVLATQRPSVDVITGLIKANVPARIAFSVSSIVDSRTILDTSGAEKLLGRGDMLFLSADLGKPKRLQGAYANDDEISGIIKHLKKQADPEYLDGVVEKQGGVEIGGGGAGGEDADPLLGEAKEVILQAKKASASLLQRRLRVGYARAARLLDLLEEQGFIGPADGAKPREILMDALQKDKVQREAPAQPEVEEEDEEDDQDYDDGDYEEGDEDESDYEDDDGEEGGEEEDDEEEEEGDYEEGDEEEDDEEADDEDDQEEGEEDDDEEVEYEDDEADEEDEDEDEDDEDDDRR